MTHTAYAISKGRLLAKLAAGVAFAGTLAIGAFATPANAEWDGHYRNYGYDHDHYYNGGYYTAPPVVYGSPYGGAYYGAPAYYPPPLVYGPGIGINFGGIGIGIR